MDRVPCQANSPPQPGVPCQVVPAAAHPSATAELIGGQMGEDLEESLIWKNVNWGLFLLHPSGWPDVGAGQACDGRSVDHGNRLPGDRG